MKWQKGLSYIKYPISGLGAIMDISEFIRHFYSFSGAI